MGKTVGCQNIKMGVDGILSLCLCFIGYLLFKEPVMFVFDISSLVGKLGYTLLKIKTNLLWSK